MSLVEKLDCPDKVCLIFVVASRFFGVSESSFTTYGLSPTIFLILYVFIELFV